MMVSLLFIIGLMGLFFYNKRGSIIPAVDLPTTEIIEPLFVSGSFYFTFPMRMVAAMVTWVRSVQSIWS